MQFESSKKRYEPSLDVTPLIDVVFLLLVFLLLTMTFAKDQVSKTQEAIIDIELAKSSSADAPIETAQVDLLLNDKGMLYIDDNTFAISREDAKILIAERLIQEPQLSVNLRADHRASHGQVIECLDLLKSLDIQRVNLIIDQR